GRPRGTHRIAPALPAIGPRMGRERLAGGMARGAHTPAIDRAVLEVAGGERDAADGGRLHQERVVVAPDDALGRTPANVHHEPVLSVERQLVSGAEIDQASLLAARDDADREAEGGLGRLD